jgi:gp16 family phage-associated protein
MPPSLEQLRSAFEQAGVSVTDWAVAHGFRRENVYAVLSGRAKGRRGQSHRIAAALGLKPQGVALPWLSDSATSGIRPLPSQDETAKEPNMA